MVYSDTVLRRASKDMTECEKKQLHSLLQMIRVHGDKPCPSTALTATDNLSDAAVAGPATHVPVKTSMWSDPHSMSPISS